MAQALRTVWLEPEEQQEPLAPQITPRHRRRATKSVRQSPLAVMCMVAMVAIAVGLVVAYINSYARIAHYEFQRQALTTQLRQLQGECSQLQLDVARLENTPRVTKVAALQNMVFPTADRVHYVQVASTDAATVAQTAPAHRSWFARAGRQMVAQLHGVAQHLGRGPGAPAYAQE